MALFDKLFGKKPAESPSARPAPESKAAPTPVQPPPSDPSKDPNLIRAHDAYGREFFIKRQDWWNNVLSGNLTKAWDNPEDLYGFIVAGLRDGFGANLVEATEHLYRTDPVPSRGACLWGVVLLEQGRLNDAETVLQDYLNRYGDEGYILLNLAKVHDKRGESEKADQILWHTLEVDPNQANGFGWYLTRSEERGGEAGKRAALERIAAMPGSWRAPLWQARAALQAGQLDVALAHYRNIFQRIAAPVPADFLYQMSGDLGQNGHLRELLALAEPHFRPDVHGIETGNNLIKAHFDLGELPEARKIIETLYACQRPDWAESLRYWETRITQSRIAATPPVEDGPIELTVVTYENPIWLPGSSAATALFPDKLRPGLLVSFLGSTAEIETAGARIQLQMSDAPGRLSRALPLFLAEQAFFRTTARVSTLIPTLHAKSTGFLFSPREFSDEDAVTWAKSGESAGDIVVKLHLVAKSQPWTAMVRVIRVSDGVCLAAFAESFFRDNPAEGIIRLSRQLLDALADHGASPVPAPPLYQVPPTPSFANYLLRLEQILSVRRAGMEDSGEFLSGEREILNGNFQLCADCPDNPTTRLLLAQTLLSMSRVRPEILPEFRDKATMLRERFPVDEPIRAVTEGIMREALNERAD